MSSDESKEMTRHSMEISNEGSQSSQSKVAADENGEKNNKEENRKIRAELREKMITYLEGFEKYFIIFIRKLVDFLQNNQHDFQCLKVDSRRNSIYKVVSKPGENECVLSEMEKVILEMYEKTNNHITFFQNILGKYANRTQRFQVKEANLQNMDGKFEKVFNTLNRSFDDFMQTYQESKYKKQHENPQNAVTNKLERVMANFKQVQEPFKNAEKYFPAQ